MDYESPSVIKEVGELISKPFPSDVEKHIEALHRIYFKLIEQTAEWTQLVYEKRKQMLWPKDTKLTEMDRRVRLEGDIAFIEKDYEFLKLLHPLIEHRLDTALELLRKSPQGT